MLSGGFEICAWGYCTGDEIIGDALSDAWDATSSTAEAAWDVTSSTAEAVWAGVLEGEPIESYDGEYDIHVKYLGENVRDTLAPIGDAAASIWNAEIEVGDYNVGLANLGDNFVTIGESLCDFGRGAYNTLSAMWGAVMNGDETVFADTYDVHTAYLNETDDTIYNDTMAFLEGASDLFDFRYDTPQEGDSSQIRHASLWPFF